MQKKILYTLILVLFFAACKYEDGPAISLRSKYRRLLKIWQIENVKTDGIDSTKLYKDSCGCDLEFYSSTDHNPPAHEDVVFFRNCKYNPNSGAAPTQYCCPQGYFEFQDHNKTLRVNSFHAAKKGYGPIGNGDSYWSILRLTHDEFWFKTNFNGKEYDFKLKYK